MVQGVDIVDGEIVSKDPATGAELGRVRVSTPSDIAQAVNQAKAAQAAATAVAEAEAPLLCDTLE